jgi:hypothetical protein
MNAKGASILSNPHPCGHIVYPYTDEGLVGQAVALFASAGLRDNEGVILIMSNDHCESFKLRLQLEGINTEKYERLGQLICVTAEETLGKFMRDDLIDEDLFRIAVGSLIEKVRGSVSNGHSGKVRLFGEMVSQLRGTNLKATTRLEELWNQVIEKHSVSLLCTYALEGEDDRIHQGLLDLHSQNIEREPVV